MADDTPLSDLLTQPVERAAREVALRLLAEADKERQRLGKEDDPEALHDFRVAVRRLRSWLKSFKDPLKDSVKGKHRDSLREIARATNPGRDAEVHIQWLRERPALFRLRRREGTEWLIARLESEYESAARSLAEVVEKDFTALHRTLADRLDVYPRRVRCPPGETSFAAAAADRIRAQAAELRVHVEEVKDPSDVEKAHATRIAAKHLRYLLEPVTGDAHAAQALIDRLKDLQDVLGALHDAHVFGSQVAAALMASAAEQAGKLSATVLEGDARRRSLRRVQRDPLRPGLLAIARRLRATADASFKAFAEGWAGDAAAFWDEADRTAAALGGLGGAPQEIERKYLLERLPDTAKDTKPLLVEQGYLPGTHLVERVRRVKHDGPTRFYRTVKLGAGLVRTEVEEETTRAVFSKMWPLTKGRRLKKRRHRVRDGQLVWEIDDFADRKLVLAEVELKDGGQDVEIPKWLRRHVVREVTDEEEYQNVRLAR
jgi:CHAD domain-containing protein/CYTH domain-containing protein